MIYLRDYITLKGLLVRDVTVKYGLEIVLKKLSFEHAGRGLIQILGPNGAGKSTLLRTIAGLVKPISGRVIVNGVDVTGRPDRAGKYVGYVPQLTGAVKVSYPITLYELVHCCFVLTRKWPRIGAGDEGREAVENALKEVGLPRSKWFKRLEELSGGEIQRGYIARAIVKDPEILLLDEPFSSIDPEGRVELAEKISEFKKDKLVVVTTHDPSLMLPHTDYMLLINRDLYYYGEPGDVLRKEVLERIYGRGFVEHAEHVHIIDSHV